MISAIIALSASSLKPVFVNAGVSTGPGLRPLTRIPRGSSSADSVRASDSRAALLAAYTLLVGRPMRALTEPQRIIEDGLFSSGSSAWIKKNGPFRLMFIRRSQASSCQASSGACVTSPALRNTASRRGQRAARVSASAFCEVISPASVGITQALSPRMRSASARVSGLRPVTATRAPSAINACAVARPMPLVPPVINVYLSVKRPMFFS